MLAMQYLKRKFAVRTSDIPSPNELLFDSVFLIMLVAISGDVIGGDEIHSNRKSIGVLEASFEKYPSSQGHQIHCSAGRSFTIRM